MQLERARQINDAMNEVYVWGQRGDASRPYPSIGAFTLREMLHARDAVHDANDQRPDRPIPVLSNLEIAALYVLTQGVTSNCPLCTKTGRGLWILCSLAVS